MFVNSEQNVWLAYVIFILIYNYTLTLDKVNFVHYNEMRLKFIWYKSFIYKFFINDLICEKL